MVLHLDGEHLASRLATIVLQERTFGGNCAMKLDKTTIRARSSPDAGTCLSVAALVLLLFCGSIQQTAGAQQQRGACGESSLLTTTQVVEKLVEVNFRRAKALHSYHGTRTYRVEYRGLLRSTSAVMVVDVIYRASVFDRFDVDYR
jgi:hypothetical protein